QGVEVRTHEKLLQRNESVSPAARIRNSHISRRFFMPFALHFLPQKIDAMVSGDLRDPRGEVQFRLKASDLEPCLRENILSGVFRVTQISEKSPTREKDSWAYLR